NIKVCRASLETEIQGIYWVRTKRLSHVGHLAEGIRCLEVDSPGKTPVVNTESAAIIGRVVIRLAQLEGAKALVVTQNTAVVHDPVPGEPIDVISRIQGLTDRAEVVALRQPI